MHKNIIFCLLLILLSYMTVFSQTTTNPDISLVGDLRIFSHDDASRPDEVEELNIANPELELVVSGYLNPYARADAVFAWHGEHNAEIEEAYITFLRGLPLGANIKAGKYLLEFGRLNPVHPHAWSFIKRPLPHKYFFGDHGLIDMAVRPSFLLPTGNVYTEIMGGLLKGDALAEHEHGREAEEEHMHEEEEGTGLGFLGRLTSSFGTSENSELAVGFSALNAVHGSAEHGGEELPEEHHQLRTWIIGGDLKYKYIPSRYTSLQIEMEGLMRIAEQSEGDDLESFGAYGYVDYRFARVFNIGGIAEFVNLKHLHEGIEEEEKISRFGLFAGFAPIEETSLLRLVGHWTEPEEGDGFWEVTLQCVFSLGPHKSHNF